MSVLLQRVAKFKEYQNTKVMSHRGGMRLWLQGARPAFAGFVRGAKYRVEKTADGFTLHLDPNGKHTVSGKRRNDVQIPVIDLRLSSDTTFNLDDRLIAVFFDSSITISIHHEQQRKAMREKSFAAAVLGDQELTEACLCAGGGISTAATHAGISRAGLKSKVAYVVDQSLKYLQVAAKNNFAIDDDTAFVQSKLEEVPFGLLPHVNVLSFSFPCANFSKAGAAKHKLAPEEHEAATALFGLINIITQSNPAVIWSENVPTAQHSPIFLLLKAELVRRGYRITEEVTANQKTASLEHRERYWFMAVSDGLPKQLTENIFNYKLKSKKKVLNDIRDIDADSDESNWFDHDYLKEKQVADKLKGNGFAKRQLITGEESHVGTIGRFYFKRRSTEPFWVRDDGKERLMSLREHAAVKQVPFSLVRGISDSLGHEILGQSIDFMQGMIPMYRLMLNAVDIFGKRLAE